MARLETSHKSRGKIQIREDSGKLNYILRSLSMVNAETFKAQNEAIITEHIEASSGSALKNIAFIFYGHSSCFLNEIFAILTM